MKTIGSFHINGELKRLPVYEKGDRVKLTDAGIGATGTVDFVAGGGLLLEIQWDKKQYPDKNGGYVILDKKRLPDSIELLTS